MRPEEAVALDDDPYSLHEIEINPDLRAARDMLYGLMFISEHGARARLLSMIEDLLAEESPLSHELVQVLIDNLGTREASAAASEAFWHALADGKAGAWLVEALKDAPLGDDSKHPYRERARAALLGDYYVQAMPERLEDFLDLLKSPNRQVQLAASGNVKAMLESLRRLGDCREIIILRGDFIREAVPSLYSCIETSEDKPMMFEAHLFLSPLAACYEASPVLTLNCLLDSACAEAETNGLRASVVKLVPVLLTLTGEQYENLACAFLPQWKTADDMRLKIVGSTFLSTGPAVVPYVLRHALQDPDPFPAYLSIFHRLGVCGVDALMELLGNPSFDEAAAGLKCLIHSYLLFKTNPGATYDQSGPQEIIERLRRNDVLDIVTICLVHPDDNVRELAAKFFDELS